MKVRHLLSAALLATGTAASADVVYTYTGQNYTSYAAPYTAADRLTGTFTIANPLAPNLNDEQLLQVLDFSFSDGIETVSKGPGTLFPTFYTGAVGNIIGYDLEVLFGDPTESGDPYGLIDAYYFAGSLLPDGVAEGGTEAAPDVCGGGGCAVSDRAGTLVESTVVTPEPASLVLLGTGLVGMGGLVRRRLFRS